MYRSNLSKFLKRLQVNRLIERDIVTRKYRIIESGKNALNKRDDVQIIASNRRILESELQPNYPEYPHETGPLLMPVTAAVYLSPEIEVVINDTLEESRTTNNQDVKQVVLAELAEPTVRLFEDMLVRRFNNLSRDLLAYGVQKMSPADRKRYFQRHFWMIAGKKVQPDEHTIEVTKQLYMEHKLPPEGPDLSIENVLDYEAALVVQVSRESLRKNMEAIKNRLAWRLLSDLIQNPSRLKDHILAAMAKAGIISPDEHKAYFKARSEKSGRRVLINMWRTGSVRNRARRTSLFGDGAFPLLLRLCWRSVTCDTDADFIDCQYC